MQAKMGDWLVIKGLATVQGLITEVRSSDGSPPYVVRWLDTGRVAMVFPGPDAVVVTADAHNAADERSVPGSSCAGGHCAPYGQCIIQRCCAAAPRRTATPVVTRPAPPRPRPAGGEAWKEAGRHSPAPSRYATTSGDTRSHRRHRIAQHPAFRRSPGVR
jgi:Domain of unknown function (DUF1918)